MRLFFVLPVLLAITLASDGAFMTPPWRPGGVVPRIAEGPPTKRRASFSMPVELPPTFPPEGVDHVATYSWQHSGGALPDDRITTLRHGSIVRSTTSYSGRPGVPKGELSSYSNIATGASISIYPDTNGRLRTASLWREGSGDSPLYRHTITTTGTTEVIAGERCTTRVAKPEAKSGVTYSACITSDGIVLRQTTHNGGGSVMMEARAINIERRPVALSEVLPPREMLDWAYWTEARGRTPINGAIAGNYQITLIERGSPVPGLKIIRASNGWRSEDTQSGTGDRGLAITGPSIRFSYSSQSSQLGFSRTYNARDVQRVAHRPGIDLPPLDRESSGRIGEPCTWFGSYGGGSSLEECRTRDGLPLIIDWSSEFVGAGHWLAVDLTRGQTPPTALAPPAWMLNWSYWGWSELDRGQTG